MSQLEQRVHAYINVLLKSGRSLSEIYEMAHKLYGESLTEGTLTECAFLDNVLIETENRMIEAALAPFFHKENQQP